MYRNVALAQPSLHLGKMRTLSIAFLVFVGRILSAPIDESDEVAVDVDADNKVIDYGQFNPHLFQGDILLPRKRSGNPNTAQRWPSGVIPYVLDQYMGTRERQMIQQAINYYKANTCIQWVPRTNQRDYVQFRSANTGCFSMIGRVGGAQTLNLASNCYRMGTVLHEMLHAAGFFHEMAREDRDQYVNIHWSNIQLAMRKQFDVQRGSLTYGTKYDIESVMQYPADAFTRNGKYTITPKDTRYDPRRMGLRNDLSQTDLYRLRTMYQCGSGTGTGTMKSGSRLGCYSGVAGNQWTDNALTPERCLRHCRTYGFQYAAVKGANLCICPQSLGSKVSEWRCRKRSVITTRKHFLKPIQGMMSPVEEPADHMLAKNLVEIREKAKEWGLSDSDIDICIEKILQEWKDEERSPIKKFLVKICKWFAVFVLALGLLAVADDSINNGKVLTTVVLKVTQYTAQFDHPMFRLWRSLWLPLNISTAYYDENCVIYNPAYTYKMPYCSCVKYKAVRDATRYNRVVRWKNQYRPFTIQNAEQPEVTLEDLKETFQKHDGLLEVGTVLFDSNNDNVAAVRDMFSEEGSQIMVTDEQIHVTWETRRILASTVWRQLFLRPKFVSNTSEVSVEKYLFLDGPQTTFAMPNFIQRAASSVSNSYYIQSHGRRLLTLTPVPSCQEQCSELTVVMNTTNILSFNHELWQIKSAPVDPADKLSIAFVAHFAA